MAYYGGEEQRKKDEKKAKIDAFMDKAMPKRTFDQLGRETDRRTGKLKENIDPLGDLWSLYETVMEKPPLQDESPVTVDTPEDQDYEHPVSQERRKVDVARASGMEPEQAHETVYGEVDTGDANAKAQLAATLGRVQNDGAKKGVKIEKDKEFKSLLAKDDEMEQQDAVTPDDMRTPQQKEVPNALQQPAGMSNTIDAQEEYDYNEDVAFLQKYGRA